MLGKRVSVWWIVVLLSLIGIWSLHRTTQLPVLSSWQSTTAGVLQPVAPTALAKHLGLVPLTPLPITSTMLYFTGRGAGNDAAMPWGNPLQQQRTVITQGYGVGSHAPASVWGGVDLAIDGDGDGQADPQGTWDARVYATHAGVVELSPNSYPAGNHIALHGDGGWRTGYAHLKGFAVADGASVTAGTVIGYVGSTGQSSGPHLHYDVWHNGVNVNPLEHSVLP